MIPRWHSPLSASCGNMEPSNRIALLKALLSGMIPLVAMVLPCTACCGPFVPEIPGRRQQPANSRVRDRLAMELPCAWHRLEHTLLRQWTTWSTKLGNPPRSPTLTQKPLQEVLPLLWQQPGRGASARLLSCRVERSSSTSFCLLFPRAKCTEKYVGLVMHLPRHQWNQSSPCWETTPAYPRRIPFPLCSGVLERVSTTTSKRFG